jgi:hypothetical protein
MTDRHSHRGELTPDTYLSLAFHDFPDAAIYEVADYLYEREPHFMNRLEADIRQHGVSQPVELGEDNTIEDGHHRIAAAYRADIPVPTVVYGEWYAKDAAEVAAWLAIRQEHPAEQGAAMAHDPRTWDAEPLQLDRELEAG